MIDWYIVSFDEAGIYRQVAPPDGEEWHDEIPWKRIIRVCFLAADFIEPDELYLFTDERPESYVVPMSATGGGFLLDELIRRGLFPAELAIQAASASGQLFCWPEA